MLVGFRHDHLCHLEMAELGDGLLWGCRWILKNWPEPKNLDKDEKHALGSLEKYLLLSTFCCVALRTNVVDPLM